MISIKQQQDLKVESTGKTVLSTAEIVFTPRVGFSKVHKQKTYKLEYAHVCPGCGNVIQALFHTDQEVDLNPYEETRIMTIDTDGKKPMELKGFSPDEKDPNKTHYNVYYDAKTKSQKIVLKNHILRFESIDLKNADEKADWEPGGKVCELSGLFSLREDLVMRDYVLFSRINESKVWDFPVKSISDVKFNNKLRVCGFPVEAIGDAPPVILIRYNIINRGWEHAVSEFLGHIKNT